MKKYLKKYFWLLLILVTGVFVLLVFWNDGGYGLPTYSSGATNTAVVVGQSALIATSTIVTPNGSREYLSICNIGTTAVTLCLDNTSCSFNQGITLDERGTSSSTKVCQQWENNPPGGRIIAVVNATTSTSTVEVIER